MLYSYDDQGQLKQVADALGVVEGYVYDNDKNLSKCLNAKDEPAYTAVYDDYHRAISEITFGKEQKKAFNLRNHTLDIAARGKNAFHCQYDNNYRLLEAQDSSSRSVKMAYEEGQSKPKTITDCMGNEKHYSYDDRGNIIRIVDALGTEERFWYNENNQQFAYLDGMGKAELYSYNANGRIIKIHHAAKFIAEDLEKGTVNFTYGQNHITEYVYDGDHLLYSLREGKVMHSYQHDDEGMLIAVQTPSGYTLHRGYDERGRLQKVWDSEGDGLEYIYDDRDRVIQIANRESSIEYGYDDVGNLSLITNAQGEATQHIFDTFGNLITIVDAMEGITSYEYDENHNLTRTLLPNGTVQEIEYDSFNRAIKDKAG